MPKRKAPGYRIPSPLSVRYRNVPEVTSAIDTRSCRSSNVRSWGPAEHTYSVSDHCGSRAIGRSFGGTFTTIGRGVRCLNICKPMCAIFPKFPKNSKGYYPLEERDHSRCECLESAVHRPVRLCDVDAALSNVLFMATRPSSINARMRAATESGSTSAVQINLQPPLSATTSIDAK